MTGEGVEIELALDPEPASPSKVPEDFARALDADPAARAAYDRLTHSRQTGARARHREREEARDAQTADRQGPGNPKGPESLTDPRAARRGADVRVAASKQVRVVAAEVVSQIAKGRDFRLLPLGEQ